ncbi:MAG: LEA type 2 family protein [Bacteroidales bacterium]|jgi:LEA14-like dessication related protein|nr:LEA type 2 family protein [Bacteroidales bacterium]
MSVQLLPYLQWSGLKKYLVFAVVCFPLLFSGCTLFENIELRTITDVTYREFRDMVLRLEVEAVISNPNRFAVKVKEANMHLMLNDQVIGTITQMEQIALKGRTTKDYTFHIAIQMNDFQTNLNALYRLLMNDTKKLSLSGTLKVKSFFYHKSISIDKVTFQ